VSESIAVGLRSALAAAYGLPDAELDRVANGQSTLNYAGTAGGRRIFVKCYPTDTDLHAERHAIMLSEYAGEAGVPTARVVASRQGELIHATDTRALSVWEFADGQSADSAPLLTPERMSTAGHAVGRLHRVLASHPGLGPTLRPGAEVCHLETAAKAFTATLAAYTALTEPSDFDRWTVEVLRWRLSLMPRMAQLLSSLPPLTSQLIHGDLASPNLLYRDASLTAIIDFRPPRPRQLAWEISRLACDPRTIVRRPDWLHGLQGFLTAYQATSTTPNSDDMLATVRVWLCYTATSIYPFNELINGQPLFPDQLRSYAHDRQDALVTGLTGLDTIEATVRDCVAA
jgi:Ser/Thr protein kinase RdoA (MazF antagonist)